MKIRITTDSTSDLSARLLAQHDIKVIPLYVVKDDVSYKDSLEITPNDIFEYVDSGKGICTTAAVNVGDYLDFFSEMKQDCDAIIHFNISSEMSCCHVNAVLAAEDMENVHVIDSRNLSTGIGHLVLDAALMAEAGDKTAEEICDIIRAEVDKVEASFVIDTLKYLHKGGRCSAVAALGANILKLKPCIEVKDGKMDVGKKYRGPFSTVILQYVRDRLTGRDDLDLRRVFITYAAGTPAEVVDAVENEVRACAQFEEIIRTQAGCTISNHCGPVCLGVLFFRK